MRFSFSLLASLVTFSLLDPAFASKIHSAGARNRHVARSLTVNATDELAARSLEKRFDNARFSFFDTGLGACGGTNSRNDFVVALNHIQFDSGDWCYKTITITYGGKSTQAQVVDRCVECPPGALDFTRGLFDFFASERAGYLWGSWSVGSGTPPKPTTTTPKWTPEPTPTPTTTSIKTTVTSLTNSSTNTSTFTSAASSSAVPSATAGPVGVWAEVHNILLNIGNIAIEAAVVV